MSTLIPGSKLERIKKKAVKTSDVNHYFINSPRRKKYYIKFLGGRK
jgi:hypothetical protein